MKRKDFLKMAGLTALAGVGGKWAAVASPGRAVKGKKGGPKWALAVDLLKCRKEKDCDKCVQACHTEHNVPDFGNKKDEIKWIWKEPFKHAFHGQAHEFMKKDLKHCMAPLLCNHCENPPCTKVCPTKATWRRESDGIVMMDWHRCIGCRYCVAACPYGSRSFNWRDPRPHIKKIREEFPTRTIGVVEKCTLCEHRLAKGKKPACVEGCPKDALVFGDLEKPESKVRKLLDRGFSLTRKAHLGTRPRVYYVLT